jgi:hypothetical protein
MINGRYDMTRKDYQAIADEFLHSVRTHGLSDQITDLVLGLCHVFAEDNPRFDADRFTAAALLGTVD